MHDRCRCLDVAGSFKVLAVKSEPGVLGELLEEGSLGPPVAFTERMNRVDLAQVVGQPVDERATFQVLQGVLAAQRGRCRESRYPSLAGDIETVDYSGWPIYCRADAPDEFIEKFCRALIARRDAIGSG